MIKIFIHGGRGNMAQAILTLLLERLPSNEAVQIIFYSRSLDASKSITKDYHATLQKKKHIQLIESSDYQSLQLSHIVIQAAGISAAETNASTRGANLGRNCLLAFDFAKWVKQFAPKALLLNAANPVELTTTTLIESGNFPVEQVFGIGSGIDVARFKTKLQRLLRSNYQLDVSIEDIKVNVSGAHLNGFMKFQVESVFVENQSLADVLKGRETTYNAEDITRLCEKAVWPQGFDHVENVGKSASITPANEIVKIVCAHLGINTAYETTVACAQTIEAHPPKTHKQVLCFAQKVIFSHNQVVIQESNIPHEPNLVEKLLAMKLSCDDDGAEIRDRAETEEIEKASFTVPPSDISAEQYSATGKERIEEIAKRNKKYASSFRKILDLAKWYFIHGHHELAKQQLLQLLTTTLHRPRIALKVNLDLAMACTAAGDIEQAKICYQHIWEIWPKVHRNINISELSTTFNKVKHLCGKLQIPSRFKIEKKISSVEINSPCRFFNNLANLFLYTATSDDSFKSSLMAAQQLYQYAYEVCKKYDKNNRLYLAITLENLAHASILLGEEAQALKANSRALEIFVKEFPDNAFHCASAFNNTANLLKACKQSSSQTILSYRMRALKLLQEQCYPNKQHSDIAFCAYNIAMEYLDSDQKEKARVYLDLAYEHAKATLPCEHIFLEAITQQYNESKYQLPMAKL